MSDSPLIGVDGNVVNTHNAKQFKIGAHIKTAESELLDKLRRDSTRDSTKLLCHLKIFLLELLLNLSNICLLFALRLVLRSVRTSIGTRKETHPADEEEVAVGALRTSDISQKCVLRALTKVHNESWKHEAMCEVRWQASGVGRTHLAIATIILKNFNRYILHFVCMYSSICIGWFLSIALVVWTPGERNQRVFERGAVRLGRRLAGARAGQHNAVERAETEQTWPLDAGKNLRTRHGTLAGAALRGNGSGVGCGPRAPAALWTAARSPQARRVQVWPRATVDGRLFVSDFVYILLFYNLFCFTFFFVFYKI